MKHWLHTKCPLCCSREQTAEGQCYSHITDYIGGIQYDGVSTLALSFIQTEEGKEVPNGTGYNYVYYLGDHLGNTRVTFETKTGSAVAIQKDDYYPFGMEINTSVTSPKNEYLYNKKELQEELGQYDYGARFYDPVIARWTSVDPLAEKGRRWSPYAYLFNNPLRFIDPDGMWGDYYGQQGQYLGNDGKDDGKTYLLRSNYRPNTENQSIPWGNTLTEGQAKSLRDGSDEVGGLVIITRTSEGTDSKKGDYTIGSLETSDGTVSFGGQITLRPALCAP